jgi:hypothetical protein
MKTRIAMASLAVALAGCVETKDEFTLNPDGSGKVKHEAIFQPINLNRGAEKPSPEEEAKAAARKELEKAEGVEAWRDVSFERGRDGRVLFAGTAYFRNLAKLRFYNNGFKAATYRPSWTNGTLELETEHKQAEEKPVPRSDAEVDAAVAETRAQFQQMKPMMAGLMGSMKTDMSFRLPGTLMEVSNLKREADGRLRIQFTGAQLLAASEKVMGDDALLRAQVRAGRNVLKDGPEGDLATNQELFGEAKPVRAVVKPDPMPLFSYVGEVAMAKAQMAAVFKMLGAVAAAPVAPAGSAVLKEVRVGGVRWVRVSDRDRDIRPFNQEAGYALSLLADLPGSVLKLSGGALTKVVTDNGDDLLPAKEWDRRISFPDLSKDKTVAVLDLKLGPLPAATRGFREIAGYIAYLVGGQTRKVDAGFAELAVGARGKELGATVKSLKAGSGTRSAFALELQLNVRRDLVKAVEVLDASGQSCGATIGGHSGSDTLTTLTLNLAADVPKDGRIVVELFDDLKRFEAPFSLRDITLLGEPMR